MLFVKLKLANVPGPQAAPGFFLRHARGACYFPVIYMSRRLDRALMCRAAIALLRRSAPSVFLEIQGFGLDLIGAIKRLRPTRAAERLTSRLEVHRHAVDAVAQMRRRRAVLEDMAQMLPQRLQCTSVRTIP